jgi:hypothetical protein
LKAFVDLEEEFLLRKLVVGAVAAAAALGFTGAAVAQTEGVSVQARIAPAKAGTAKKPKAARLSFAMSVNLPTATVGDIKLRWPATVRMSGKGFKRCNFDDLIATGPTACPGGSAAGAIGSAAAAVGPARAPLIFRVNAFVEDANTLLFYLNQAGGGVQTVVRGEIRGRQLTITIPQELRQPGGLDATLTSLRYTFAGKAGKNAIVATTGCKARRHALTGTLDFSPRLDGAAVPAPVSSSVNSACRA